MEQRKDYLLTQLEMLTNALKKLLDKILKLKTEENGENAALSASINDVNNLLRIDLLKIEDRFLIQTLVEKNNFTNTQIKILADILFENIQTLKVDNCILNKVQILYKYYQENEKKTIDFIVFSRLTELEERIKAAK